MNEWGWDEVQTAVILITAVVAVILYYRSAAGRLDRTELQGLADTRGRKIDDLEKLVAEQERRIERLEGMYQALVDVKADAVADAVVARAGVIAEEIARRLEGQ